MRKTAAATGRLVTISSADPPIIEGPLSASKRSTGCLTCTRSMIETRDGRTRAAAAEVGER